MSGFLEATRANLLCAASREFREFICLRSVVSGTRNGFCALVNDSPGQPDKEVWFLGTVLTLQSIAAGAPS